jgi:hypothetical protein
MIAYCVFLILRGLFSGNYIKYLLFDIHIYTSFVFLTYFNSQLFLENKRIEIPILFGKLLIISIPLVLILLTAFGTINLSDPFDRGIISGKAGFEQRILFAPILIAPFIVPFVREMSKKLKFLVLSANALLLLLGILTATRSVVAISIIAYLTLSKFSWKISVKKFITILAFFITVLLFLFINDRISSIIKNKIEITVGRFEKKVNFTSGRDTEVYGLFKDFSNEELIFGRGAGAEQKFGFWKFKPAPGTHGINFTHFGFLNLIFKGGIVLLILVYGVSLYSLVKLFLMGERRYFFVILLYLVYEISHTLFINYFHLVLLWISISYAFYLKKGKNTITSKLLLSSPHSSPTENEIEPQRL